MRLYATEFARYTTITFKPVFIMPTFMGFFADTDIREIKTSCWLIALSTKTSWHEGFVSFILILLQMKQINILSDGQSGDTVYTFSTLFNMPT